MQSLLGDMGGHRYVRIVDHRCPGVPGLPFCWQMITGEPHRFIDHRASARVDTGGITMSVCFNMIQPYLSVMMPGGAGCGSIVMSGQSLKVNLLCGSQKHGTRIH